ncbi:MAG TPA: hypothetical protein VKL40_18315 [Candidatus Angelobacter sp.]|nr:hypothetical protein [Candidatus Angelobacter sp.]
MATLTQQAITALRDEWPKALLGLIVPLAQFVWKLRKDRQADNRKDALREKIAKLALFLKTDFDASPEAAKVKEAAEQEYSAALLELAKLSDTAHRVTAVPAMPNNILRRWFLLYVPRTPLAWLPQSLFFLLAAFLTLATWGMLTDLSDPELDSTIIGLCIFAAVALGLRAWAVRANQAHPEGKPVPTWIPIALIVSAGLIEFFGFVGSALGKNDEFSMSELRENWAVVALITVLMSAIVIGAIYWMRRSRARPPSLQANPLAFIPPQATIASTGVPPPPKVG